MLYYFKNSKNETEMQTKHCTVYGDAVTKCVKSGCAFMQRVPALRVKSDSLIMHICAYSILDLHFSNKCQC